MKSADGTPSQLEGALSTKLLLSVHRNVSLLQRDIEACVSDKKLCDIQSQKEQSVVFKD